MSMVIVLVTLCSCNPIPEKQLKEDVIDFSIVLGFSLSGQTGREANLPSSHGEPVKQRNSPRRLPHKV